MAQAALQHLQGLLCVTGREQITAKAMHRNQHLLGVNVVIGLAPGQLQPPQLDRLAVALLLTQAAGQTISAGHGCSIVVTQGRDAASNGLSVELLRFQQFTGPVEITC